VELGERPGAFKKHDYVTGREEVGSMPEDVPVDIAALLDELGNFSSGETLKAAAYFHARFEYIHPFADGNGRVGRTLLNYFLMTRGHPPVIIFDEDKADYYAALEAYDKTEDIIPMYDFLRFQTGRTWQKTLERERRRSEKYSKTGDEFMKKEELAYYTPHPTGAKMTQIETTDMPLLEQVSPFDVKALFEEFMKDAAGALKIYEDKRFEVTGIAKKTGLDIHQKPSIEISNEATGECYAL
jgi:hypothetical protein